MTNDSRPQLLMIGLGKMGGRMAARLARAGAVVHGFDPSPQARADVQALVADDTVPAPDRIDPVLHADLAAAVAALPAPRIVWLMLPAGEPTAKAIATLRALLDRGDLVIDGGNANYRDSEAQGRALAEAGLGYADCGVSGGVWGLANGYCLMFGADPAAAARIEPIARRLAPAPDRGWLHCGPVGSGHFTKMIHNGIEYGMMQALAEGFALLEGRRDYALDLAAIGELWRHGSVVRSWLLDLTAEALAAPGAMERVAPFVSDSGEGRWTVDEAVRQGTPAPVIAMALMSRFDSQGKADTANKLLSLMRNAFGGHAMKVD
ncbi:MAG: phosphogluconate dehydrogenase (NAD(+)-dependent, decarboxylating) [Burkholderiaceae bacterium]